MQLVKEDFFHAVGKNKRQDQIVKHIQEEGVFGKFPRSEPQQRSDEIRQDPDRADSEQRIQIAEKTIGVSQYVKLIIRCRDEVCGDPEQGKHPADCRKRAVGQWIERKKDAQREI